MNVLVTGGAGYVGSHTCKALSRHGFQPVVCDNLVYGHKWAVKWGPLFEGDIQNTEWLADLLKKQKISAVMHFAAYAYVGESVLEPAKYYENNVRGTMSLLRAMREVNVRHLVFSSTCATYGIPKRVPINEDTVQIPMNPYGRTKKMVEDILRDYAHPNYGLKSVALRYFNAAGADANLELGEDHKPETHLIPLAVAAALQGGSITVYGSDYPTSDGTCVRDYIHVSDLAEAHVLALQYLERAPENFSYFNLGTGRGYSVREVLSAVEQITGRKLNIKVGVRREGDPPELVAESLKAANTLGWQPQWSDLKTIVQSAVRWHEHHMNSGE